MTNTLIDEDQLQKDTPKGTSKNSFLLRTAAISSRYVVGSKFVLDVALATTAAILNLRLAREIFARSRDKSNFWRYPYSSVFLSKSPLESQSRIQGSYCGTESREIPT